VIGARWAHRTEWRDGGVAMLVNAMGGLGLVILGSVLAFHAVRASLIPRDSPKRPWVAPRRSGLARIVFPFMAKNPGWFMTEASYGIVIAVSGAGFAMGGMDPRFPALTIPLGIMVSVALAVAGCYWLWRLRRWSTARFKRTAGEG
jgi:hypothetical protein